MDSRSRNAPEQSSDVVDVVLIGGGIMSATLGSMIAVLEPEWNIVLLEQHDRLASESSDPWNNAGTGHSGYCELNYMPDPRDGSKPASIARQFQLTREWWASLSGKGLIDPTSFIHTTPHLDLVFGRRDVDDLRERCATLRADPLFREMEFTDDPEVIRGWAPLVADGRTPGEPIAATRMTAGTDVDFGSLTRGLSGIISGGAGEVRLGHEVQRLRRSGERGWIVSGRNERGAFSLHARFVFVGAGGYALELLQKARLPEVRGYAVLPVGAAFLRCSRPELVAQHDAKVYGQAAIGAPPMSVPHLDKRIVDDRGHLMFGPYATFSTKLLKSGRLSDFFRTLRWTNVHVMAAAVVQNLPLIRYLIGQLLAGRRARFAELRRYYPAARFEDWELISAGQRAQLVKPARRRVGTLQQGTELVTSADGTIAGLLGASPGASTAVPIMLELLERCFAERWRTTWRDTLDGAIPGRTGAGDAEHVGDSLRRTSAALRLVGSGRLP